MCVWERDIKRGWKAGDRRRTTKTCRKTHNGEKSHEGSRQTKGRRVSRVLACVMCKRFEPGDPLRRAVGSCEGVKCYQISCSLSLALCDANSFLRCIQTSSHSSKTRLLLFFKISSWKGVCSKLGEWKSLEPLKRLNRSKTHGSSSPSCECCSEQELSAKDFAGCVCSEQASGFSFPRVAFQQHDWFVDLAAESVDLFHMNHWTLQTTLDGCWPQAESVTENEMFWFPFSP